MTTHEHERHDQTHDRDAKAAATRNNEHMTGAALEAALETAGVKVLSSAEVDGVLTLSLPVPSTAGATPGSFSFPAKTVTPNEVIYAYQAAGGVLEPKGSEPKGSEPKG